MLFDFTRNNSYSYNPFDDDSSDVSNPFMGNTNLDKTEDLVSNSESGDSANAKRKRGRPLKNEIVEPEQLADALAKRKVSLAQQENPGTVAFGRPSPYDCADYFDANAVNEEHRPIDENTRRKKAYTYRVRSFSMAEELFDTFQRNCVECGYTTTSVLEYLMEEFNRDYTMVKQMRTRQREHSYTFEKYFCPELFRENNLSDHKPVDDASENA